ncbi:hypothetical protein, partial [Burkholderia pseudomallei]|uniref:hypothetical protein n=1 Tax=Burkholderia pseudomallei TaxID=28450 RepID=UPI001C4D682F
ASAGAAPAACAGRASSSPAAPLLCIDIEGLLAFARLLMVPSLPISLFLGYRQPARSGALGKTWETRKT